MLNDENEEDENDKNDAGDSGDPARVIDYLPKGKIRRPVLKYDTEAPAYYYENCVFTQYCESCSSLQLQ